MAAGDRLHWKNAGCVCGRWGVRLSNSIISYGYFLSVGLKKRCGQHPEIDQAPSLPTAGLRPRTAPSPAIIALGQSLHLDHRCRGHRKPGTHELLKGYEVRYGQGDLTGKPAGRRGIFHRPFGGVLQGLGGRTGCNIELYKSMRLVIQILYQRLVQLT